MSSSFDENDPDFESFGEAEDYGEGDGGLLTIEYRKGQLFPIQSLFEFHRLLINNTIRLVFRSIDTMQFKFETIADRLLNLQREILELQAKNVLSEFDQNLITLKNQEISFLHESQKTFFFKFTDQAFFRIPICQIRFKYKNSINVLLIFFCSIGYGFLWANQGHVLGPCKQELNLLVENFIERYQMTLSVFIKVNSKTKILIPTIFEEISMRDYLEQASLVPKNCNDEYLYPLVYPFHLLNLNSTQNGFPINSFHSAAEKGNFVFKILNEPSFFELNPSPHPKDFVGFSSEYWLEYNLSPLAYVFEDTYDLVLRRTLDRYILFIKKLIRERQQEINKNN